MVAYRLSDWIKAGVHIGEESFFQTDQSVPEILVSSKWTSLHKFWIIQVYENRKTGFM